MKYGWIIAVAGGLGVSACGPSSGSFSSDSINPLKLPGSGMRIVEGQPTDFVAGEFVVSIIDDTAFFLKMPQGDSKADQLLPKNTSMKVIQSGESYTKVELDSGAVGYVLTVMLENPAFSIEPVNPELPLPTGGGFPPPLPDVLPDPQSVPLPPNDQDKAAQ